MFPFSVQPLYGLSRLAMADAARAPQGGDGSDGCARCFGTSGRPSQWSSLRPCITAVTWGLGSTKAYGHRQQRAQGCGPAPLVAVTDGYVAAPVPLPGVPRLQDGDGVDSRAVQFLLKLRKKEEEEAREGEGGQGEGGARE